MPTGRKGLEGWAKRPINVSSVLQSNSYAEDDYDRGRLRNTYVVRVREKTKGRLREKDELIGSC